MSYNFQTSITTDHTTGKIISVYFQVRRGKAADVHEHADGAVFANYNKRGALLGIEVLAPCSIRVLDKIGREDSLVTRQFVKGNAPRAMIVSG